MRESRDYGSPGLGAHPRTAPEAGPRGSYCFTLSPSASLKFFLAASSSLTKVAIAARVFQPDRRPRGPRPPATERSTRRKACALDAEGSTRPDSTRLGSTRLDSTRLDSAAPPPAARETLRGFGSRPRPSHGRESTQPNSVHQLPPLGSRGPLHLLGACPTYARLPARGGPRSADLTAPPALPPGPTPPDPAPPGPALTSGQLFPEGRSQVPECMQCPIYPLVLIFLQSAHHLL